MDDVLKKFDPARVRVFTVWEKVMQSDGEPPIAATLARVTHPGAQQFWDPERAVSRQAYGETDEDSIAWDCVYLYAPGTRWDSMPPKHLFTTRPVVDNQAQLQQALASALQ